MPAGVVLETYRIGEQSAHFEWRIERWRGAMRCSPRFYFSGMEWVLIVDFRWTLGCHGVELCRYGLPSETVRCWLGARTADGREEDIGSCTVGPGRDALPSWTLSNLAEREKRLAPSGTLTILVRMRTGPEIDSKTERPEIESEQVSNSTAREVEHTRVDNQDFLILQEHFKKLLLSSDDHDVVLRVKTKEFGAHKSVLRARSPVFEAMFRHGMKESTENTVDIEDCDPDCFGQFLQYIYTGQVDDLSPSYALALYFAGDKYGLPGLRRRCVDFLQSSLSTTSVSDVINLAVTHEEKQLLETVIEYVSAHLEEVMETVEWQRFLLDNPIQANEVCLKAVKRRLTSTS